MVPRSKLFAESILSGHPMRLLLISNSTNAGESYLEYPMPHIREFLGDVPLYCLFIPYAGVTIPFDQYEEQVRERFNQIGQHLTSIHHSKDPLKEVRRAGAIVVGGGNTFQLIRMIQETGLLEPIRKKVLDGMPYIGWSAGSNLACPTIRTTNDMPVCEPPGFNAFDLVPFQINPHYTDAHPPGHAGETREQRIMEYLAANPKDTVLGLREGTMLRMESGQMTLIGRKPARVFRYNLPAEEYEPLSDLSDLLRIP